MDGWMRADEGGEVCRATECAKGKRGWQWGYERGDERREDAPYERRAQDDWPVRVLQGNGADRRGAYARAAVV